MDFAAIANFAAGKSMYYGGLSKKELVDTFKKLGSYIESAISNKRVRKDHKVHLDS